MEVGPEAIRSAGVTVVQDVELVLSAERCVLAHQLFGVGRSAARVVFDEAIVKSDAHRLIITASADTTALVPEP
jgi:hypothetical protein